MQLAVLTKGRMAAVDSSRTISAMIDIYNSSACDTDTDLTTTTCSLLSEHHPLFVDVENTRVGSLGDFPSKAK